jgi:Zn-dependent protease
MTSALRIFSLVLTVVLLMLSSVVHEVAHGFTAHLCGDDTAKEAGRLSLNPAKHLDPLGSFVLPIIMAMAGGFVFAYAKPVPYNPYRLKNRRRDEVLVSLAGPASNLLQAGIGAILVRALVSAATANPDVFLGSELFLGMTLFDLLADVLTTYMWVNLLLCFFNLIPLPPLDGSKVVCYFLKGEQLQRYYQIQQYAMPILIVALYAIPKLGIDPVGAYLDFTAGGVYDLMLMGV